MSRSYQKLLFAKGEPLFLSEVSEKACTAIVGFARALRGFFTPPN
jgi:hypothetical protein